MSPLHASPVSLAQRIGRTRPLLAGILTLALAGPILAVLPSRAADTTVRTLTDSTDTFVSKQHPTTAYGTFNRAAMTSTDYRTYLRFDTTSFKAADQITSVQLQVNVTSINNAPKSVRVNKTTAAWSPKVTYNNRPWHADAELARSGKPVVGHWLTISLPVSSLVRGATTNYQLTTTLPFTAVWIATRESKLAPRLLVTLKNATSGTASAKPSPSITAKISSSPTAKPLPSSSIKPSPSTAPKTPSPSPSASVQQPPPVSHTGTPLPFDIPSSSSLRSSGHLVFAHYWPPLPISIDNKPVASDYYTVNYLNPKGEGGKHQASGGHLRDRPIPRSPLSGSDWRIQDMRTEVRQAIDAGIDGFTLDFMQLPGDPDAQVWANAQLMMQAAHAEDPNFKVMLMPDMSGLQNRSVDTLASAVAILAKEPSAFRLADGRVVVSPFETEVHPPSWWQSFMSTMSSTYGIKIALVPLFVDSEQNHAADFKSISYGMSNWGSRNPQWNNPDVTYATSPIGRMHKVQALDEKWMQPVSVQDERPGAGIYDEAANTTNLRDSWQVAIKGGADWVQLTTWNDYTENTEFAPSVHHGYSWLDISSYYLTWFKTGKAPTIVRDAVYLTHRMQKADAKPSFPQTTLMKLRGGTSTQDTVEALTFLTKPGRVTITVGGHSTSCDVSAGVDTCTVPLGYGTVSAAVVSDGQTVAQVTSPWDVTATPYVQDLEYVAASSRR